MKSESGKYYTTRNPFTVIALWLGHESIVTTQIYLDANLTLKAQILAKTEQRSGKWQTFKPNDPLLAFVKSL